MALGNIHLTPQLIQAVRDSVDILDVAATVTRLEKRGNRYWGLCPFHKEKTPSFSLDATRGLFYCFGCGAGGDAIRLHMQSSGDDFPAAIEALARAHGIPLPAASRAARGGPDPEEILGAAADLYQAELARSREALAYLAGRRIPEPVAKRFRLGYAPDSYDFLLGALRRRYRVEDLVAVGLVASKEGGGRSWDRFRDRLIFPIFGVSGRIVGFGGRTLGEDRAKYLNTPETERFRKRHVLYGLDHARRAARERGALLLVEGYFDLLAAVSSGIDWVAASMGTALTAEQARLAARFAEEVVIGYDGDSAGEEASRKALPILLAQGLRVRRLRLPDGADPDSFRQSRGEAALAALVADAPDAVELELDRQVEGNPRSPHDLARSAKAVRELLATVPDAVVRFSYGRRAADRLGIPPDLLWRSGPDGASSGSPSSGRPAAAVSSAGRTAQPAPPGGKREVLSLEERVLQLLLSGEVAPPPIRELPGTEIFLDPVCGNIFGKFLALYTEVGGVPDVRIVLDALAESRESLDRAARILLETPSCSETAGELEYSLRQLTTRWQRERQRKLALEIREAQRRGDLVRLDALIQENNALTRALHELEA
ncbi:MAG TPA: DNA primase [Thermoanaerobaculia bacterium]|nr:DNA primase [Thermoanaerobaculia bacterium]